MLDLLALISLTVLCALGITYTHACDQLKGTRRP